LHVRDTSTSIGKGGRQLPLLPKLFEKVCPLKACFDWMNLFYWAKDGLVDFERWMELKVHCAFFS
jgi:hypothetical protein